jgi:hypothetical protein
MPVILLGVAGFFQVERTEAEIEAARKEIVKRYVGHLRRVLGHEWSQA